MPGMSCENSEHPDTEGCPREDSMYIEKIVNVNVPLLIETGRKSAIFFCLGDFKLRLSKYQKMETHLTLK